MIRSGLSADENIQALLFEKNARLQQEIPYLLQSELRKVSNANIVFETMASGVSRFSDLLAKTHIPSNPTLANTLNILIEMGFVCKEAPINDPGNAKKTHYYIDDPLSSFYYRYVYRNLSRLGKMNLQVFYEKLILPDFESQYIPHQFEKICRGFLIRQNINSKLPVPFFDIGKYYYDDPVHHKNGEFDIVTEDFEGYIFYEAKYRNSAISSEQITKEIDQVKQTGIKCCSYGFFQKVVLRMMLKQAIQTSFCMI